MVVKSPTRFKGATVENVQSYKDAEGAERVLYTLSAKVPAMPGYKVVVLAEQVELEDEA